MAKRLWNDEYWSDPDRLGLSFDAMGLYFYLCCNTHTQASGVYRLHLDVACFESRMDAKRLLVGMVELEQRDLIVYDGDEHLMWVKTFFKEQQGSWKFTLAAVRQVITLESDGFKNGWFAHNKKLLSKPDVAKRVQEECETYGLELGKLLEAKISEIPVSHLFTPNAKPAEKPTPERKPRKKQPPVNDGQADSLISEWSKLFRSGKSRVTPKRISKARARLKNWSLEQLRECLTGYHSDKWWRDNANANEFLTMFASDERVEAGIMKSQTTTASVTTETDELFSQAEKEMTEHSISLDDAPF
mgnify:FL=1